MLKALWKTLLSFPRPVRGAIAGLLFFVSFLSLLVLVPLVVGLLHR
jgi:hypothetical protein